MDRMTDLHEIQKLKARYFRLMDTRQFDALGEVFTEDLKFYIENGPLAPGSGAPAFDGRKTFVDYLKASDSRKVTVHQGHMPEIEFTGDDTAAGIWAMFDWVDDPGRGRAWQGFGHYHDQYVKGPDGQWRISEIRLSRLRTDMLEPGEAGPRPAGR